jgi:hypothetical protein
MASINPASCACLLSIAAEPLCAGKWPLIAVFSAERFSRFELLRRRRTQGVMPRLRIFSNRGWT